MKTLDKAKKGEICKIVGFNGQFDRILRRFLELGLSRGQKVRIVSTSLQNKVVLIEIRGYVLSVRRNLLDRVVVK